ncbi:hypothetical protein niasHT_015179 [Heterodera trifolii]|uniref:Uncharacterized protein n=1 Tax=Heterodera trifolii TaxID=157864 RepID=A0ABD2L9Y4_9BILA
MDQFEVAAQNRNLLDQFEVAAQNRNLLDQFEVAAQNRNLLDQFEVAAQNRNLLDQFEVAATQIQFPQIRTEEADLKRPEQAHCCGSAIFLVAVQNKRIAAVLLFNALLRFTKFHPTANALLR